MIQTNIGERYVSQNSLQTLLKAPKFQSGVAGGIEIENARDKCKKSFKFRMVKHQKQLQHQLQQQNIQIMIKEIKYIYNIDNNQSYDKLRNRERRYGVS